MANGPVRHTKQKDAVMAQLRGCDDFISAQELHRKLVDSGLRIGLATVYRQLNSLVDSGAADTVRMDGQQLFRLCGDDAHHHHLVCRKCGKTIEIDPPSESWVRKVADGLGLAMPVLALAWILRLPVISSVIVGASKPSQLESNLAASGVELPADALTEIDRILGFHRFERHVG